MGKLNNLYSDFLLYFMTDSAEKKHSNYSRQQLCNRKCCPRKLVQLTIVFCNIGKNNRKRKNKYYLSAEGYYKRRNTAAHCLKHALKRYVYSCEKKACGYYSHSAYAKSLRFSRKSEYLGDLGSKSFLLLREAADQLFIFDLSFAVILHDFLNDLRQRICIQ